MSKLLEQLAEVLQALEACSPPPALIGGLALAAHGVARATRDIDFLIAAEDADYAHARLLAHGYECVHRSTDAANYRRAAEGVDFLYAHRPIARGLLERARRSAIADAYVIGPEGIIGFKLQALANAPERPHDLADIRALVTALGNRLDKTELKRYFDLFDRPDLWRELFDER